MLGIGAQEATARLRVTLRTRRAVARRRPLRLVTAFGAYSVLAVAWLYPMASQIRSHVLQGPSDATLSMWLYWAIDHAGRTPWTATHTFLNGAPEGLPLAPALNWAAPVQPGVVWALKDSLGFIGSFNAFLLAGFVLTGFATFALADRLGLGFLASLFAGYLVAFNPWAFERAFAGHAAFLHGWVFVVLILGLLAVHRRRTLASAAVAGALFGLAFWMASYFGLIAALIVVVFYVVHFTTVRDRVERLWTFTLAAVTFAVTLVMLAPALYLYATNPAAVARPVSNTIEQIEKLSASPGSYVLPSRRHPLLGDITRSVAGSENYAEQTLYFGITTLVLALAAVALLVRRHPAAVATTERRFTVVFLAVLAPAAFYTSLPRLVEVLGVPFATPSFFITSVTTFYRVYARFGLIFGIAVAILAAVALHAMLRRRDPRGYAAAAAAVALIAFELVVWPIRGWEADKPPVHDRWLAEQPPGIVAHYPMLTDQVPAIHLAEREQYYQMFHGHPVFTIFGSGTLGTREDAIRVLTRYVDAAVTPSILAAEGVRWVFLHDDVYREQSQEPPRLPRESFRPVTEFPDVRVFEVVASPAPDVDALLVQESPQIAAAQGWRAPAIEFGEGFVPGADGARTVTGTGELVASNVDAGTTAFRLVVHGSSPNGARTLRLTDHVGMALASVALDGTPQQVSSYPFRLAEGRLALRFATDPAGPVVLLDVRLEPVVDVTNSLRPG